jgi:hypothetical protein
MLGMTSMPSRCRVVARALLAVALIAACSKSTASKTTIPQYDRMPGYKRVVFKSLFVIGLGENEQKRRLFEDVFSRVLTDDSTYAMPSWKRLPQSRLLTETELKTALGTNEFDGVLITRLVSVDEDGDEEQVEGDTSGVQRARPLEAYYQGSYQVVHEPGYYERRIAYRLETNLYAISDGGLVWAAHSAIVDPASVEKAIDSLARTVSEKLTQEGLIRRGLFTLLVRRVVEM